ncbi:GNAT family N-acetyltransferase [Clostridium sp. cel8]|jgi:GNAT superfamily N-acetyltransferase|uniref:GNAT family N-acetyltransferase n=1 Tax=unclassified Clostridium TaxID=2614128 RepID=UPI0015F45939|nr:GNAT family N-acetyltransferase [Clostridium sp. cel8]MBA5851936.1 GNAT family N-acetyltransferase [Clostridium sp. cel8]
MYECVTLMKKDIEIFQKLNDEREHFNPLNKNFFKDYFKCNFAKQISMRRKVKLIKYNSSYIGYIWVSNLNKKVYKINALNVIRGYDNTYLPYKYLSESIKKNVKIKYLCQKKNNNFDILNSIGFVKKEGTLIFKLDIDESIDFELKDGLSFHVLICGKDEELRCNIQNRIFQEKSRIPLTVDDIYYDEMQSYYLENGAIFLKKGNEFIGYGQIILENNITPILVNFGIIEKYRGHGYSKYFLKYLLKITYHNGFHNIRIKVKSSNYIAINLYKSMGFKIYQEIYNWELEA